MPFQNETTQLNSNRYLIKYKKNNNKNNKNYLNDLRSNESMLKSSIDCGGELKNIKYDSHFNTENKKQYNKKVGEVGTERLQKEQFKAMLLEKVRNIK